MHASQEVIFQWLSQYAYQPHIVYLAVVCIMLASGFGFPVPEEVTIVSVGLLSYMGAHPELFPPPYAGAPVVHGYEAAIVTMLAVIATDCLVFMIGRKFGRKLIQNPRLSRFFTEAHMAKVNRWAHKYGNYAVFMFRFTPGIRFPAHIMLGMSRLHAWQFGLVDGLAALVSVPTQILLIFHFGEPILDVLHRVRNNVFEVLAALVLAVLFWKLALPRIKRIFASHANRQP